jgi:phage terminase large subunit-like protein
VLLFAASVTELDPFWHWALAILGGGGSAGIVQGATVVTRAASTATTGGLANFVVSTVEAVAGVVFSVMAIVIPIVALVLLLVVVGVMYYVGRHVVRVFFMRRTHAR